MEEALKDLHLLFTQSPNSVVPDLATIIPLLAQKLDTNQPVFRILILRLFRDFANLPLTVVFSYAPLVTRILEPTLNDSQRAIREMAARVLNLWLMIHFLVCWNKHITWMNPGKWMKYQKRLSFQLYWDPLSLLVVAMEATLMSLMTLLIVWNVWIVSRPSIVSIWFDSVSTASIQI